MSDVLKRLCGPTQLSDGVQEVYEVPLGEVAVVRDLRVCNASGSPIRFTLELDDLEEPVDFTMKSLFHEVEIPARSTFQSLGGLILKPGEKLRAYIDSSSAMCVLVISGVESEEP